MKALWKMQALVAPPKVLSDDVTVEKNSGSPLNHNLSLECTGPLNFSPLLK